MPRNSKNIAHYCFGRGALSALAGLLGARRTASEPRVAWYIDHYFRGTAVAGTLPIESADLVCFVDTSSEPTCSVVDAFADRLRDQPTPPAAIVGMGGGATLDIAKAVSNLYKNSGRAAEYQGWDLVKHPGVYKIGIPTLSGTGAEASSTCVFTNKERNLKLGMNSPHTLFDQLILDPDLTASVPREQYFFSGMDTYIHSFESLAGKHRHAVADVFSAQALRLCEEVFTDADMMSPENREKLMLASYLGGGALANSFVGVVHPFSAGLSMVFDTHHCIANCMTMRAMQPFYPQQTDAFFRMLDTQRIELPKAPCRSLSQADAERLYASTIVHERPLENALGQSFRTILNRDRVVELFENM